MSTFSNLFGFTDYTDFSYFKSLIWGDDKKDEKKEEKEEKGKKTKKKNDEKKANTKKNSKQKKNKYDLNENQKKLILKLEKAFDNYLFRKKVRNLIQTLKDNYMIICTANIPHLYLNIIRNKKVKQYKLVYEPILKENVAFLPRKVYRNKKKLKFVICNIKKEIFIEPQYKTEYEDGSFVNVLDLSEIKDKEYKNEEDFNVFLKNYYKNNNKKEVIKKEEDEKKMNNIKPIITVNKKEELENKNDNIKVNKKEDLNGTRSTKKRRTLHKSLKSDKAINNIKINKGSSKSLLNKKMALSPILKERSGLRIKNQRKISFGNVQFSY